jgi:hypothetical protein
MMLKVLKKQRLMIANLALARFPITRNRVIDKKSRKIKKLERILIEKVYQLFRNSL